MDAASMHGIMRETIGSPILLPQAPDPMPDAPVGLRETEIYQTHFHSERGAGGRAGGQAARAGGRAGGQVRLLVFARKISIRAVH